MELAEVKRFIRDIPDFPQKGIIFKDICPLLQNPDAFRCAIDELTQRFRQDAIDVVAGIEARGFLLAAPVAYNLGVSLVLVRKAGKLPSETVRAEYALEYGSSIVEMHRDGIFPGQRVLIVDDLLATGGTMAASIELVERQGGKVAGVAFLVDLTFLDGRKRLGNRKVVSLIQF